MKNRLTHTENLITALNAVWSTLTDAEKANRFVELSDSINTLNSAAKESAIDTYYEYYIDVDDNDDFTLDFRIACF